MRKKLETAAVEFTMGPSYMEEDIREATSRMGFCEKHLSQLFNNQNRLGLALILKSHMDKMVKDIEKFPLSGTRPSLFKKKGDSPEVLSYLNDLEDHCFICSRIENTFERYIATIFYLYHNEEEFRTKFNACKGFCASHYKILMKEAANYLSGDELNTFLKELNKLFLDNMKRVSGDLEWFINKFDYRYNDEPWKNSKDALPRSMTKTNGIA
jgi:hypothetical protein